MHQFDIVLRSLQQVEAFVTLAMVQPFDILVGNEHQYINGKDLMGMFALDYSSPICVQFRCSEEEYQNFRGCAAGFLA